MSERLHEIVTGLAARLRSERASTAYRIAEEARQRVASGEPLADVLRWQLEEIATELASVDGSAFGAVAEEGEPAPPAWPVGGRPKLMAENDRRAFFQYMRANSGPVKVRVATFRNANPWCRLSGAQLTNIWRNSFNKFRADC